MVWGSKKEMERRRGHDLYLSTEQKEVDTNIMMGMKQIGLPPFTPR